MSDKPQRRLAAIFMLDVSGFSRMMAEDEEGTLNQVLAQQQSLIAPAVRAHQGRIVKLMGDGVLAVFPSVISAVEAAADIQAGAARGGQLKLRIGINLGEVIIAQGDVYGDEVNIAARLEALAPVGGVALSAAAYTQVRNRIPYKFEDLGQHEVKNIPEPVQAYALGEELTSLPGLSRASAEDCEAGPRPPRKQTRRRRWMAAAVVAAMVAAGGSWWMAGMPGLQLSQAEAPPPTVLEAAQLPPLIAVLPFTAASEPPELARALSGEVIRALASSSGLAVVAQDSSLAAAGLQPEQAAELLGAQYLVSGHLPGAPLQGIRLRIHGTSGQAVLPAHPQPNLTALTVSVASEILTYFSQPVPAFNPEQVPDRAAMQLLAARSQMAAGLREEAAATLRQALILEPGQTGAQTLQAELELDFWSGPLASLPQRAARAAHRLDGLPETPGILRIRALAAQLAGKQQAALDHARRLQQSFPNDADGHLLRAWLLQLAGQEEAAEAAYRTALRLNPVQPARYHSLRAAMLFAARQEGAATAAAVTALELDSGMRLAQAVHCAGLAGQGRIAEAGGACAQLRAARLTLDQAAGAFAFGNGAAQQRLRSALSKAGLPESP
ncbi:MAG: adenylate/guanylate cyclase domain-containing protein [Leisingera sp.]